MRTYPHLCFDDMHLVRGGEEELIRRLQTLLVMARKAVLDLLRTA